MFMNNKKNKDNVYRMLLTSFSVAMLFFLVVLSTAAYSQINTGEASIKLSAGKQKSIVFPHKTHQTVLGDCSICHNLFPMKKSGISELITQGTLKKKSVMNQCRSCHKTMAKEEKKTGPTSCKSCHTVIR